MAWVAVVEVIEDNLPSLHLLILVDLFFYRCLAFCDTLMRLCLRSYNSTRNPPFSLPCPENSGVWKVHFPEDSVSSASARALIVAHDISSRCGM